MVDVRVEIVIARPLAVVADYAADPDNTTTWYSNIHTVQWQTERPVRLGSQMDFVASFMGRELAYTYEVIEFVPHERMTMRTAEGPFPMETTYIWRAVDDGRTHMQLLNRGRPTGFAKVAAPLMARAMRRATQKDLELLKAILEN